MHSALTDQNGRIIRGNVIQTISLTLSMTCLPPKEGRKEGSSNWKIRTWAAITLCLSAINVHLAHKQSFQRQNRLWPLSADTIPWFRHLAHLGVRWNLSGDDEEAADSLADPMNREDIADTNKLLLCTCFYSNGQMKDGERLEEDSKAAPRGSSSFYGRWLLPPRDWLLYVLH